MISLNDFQRQWADTRDDALAAFDGVGRSGWYILGREVEAFEEALAAFWGVPFAVGVGSGLDALEISLRALGCSAGDRVLTTPVSAFASTLAILKLGAVPVFADTDARGLIDLEECGRILRSRADIRFFLPVHLYGHALPPEGLREIVRQSGCRLLEDCAQSIGAAWEGTATGTTGTAAATSFYPTKNLGALGDGGAILTSDAELAHAARSLRDYGQTAKYRHSVVGYNSRLDEVQAALMRRVSLPRLPGWLRRRRQIAAQYLGGIHHPAICLPGAPAGSDSCWHLFPVLVDPERKADFMAFLRSRGCATGEHYPCAIPDQPAMTGVAFESIGPLAAARAVCRGEVSLPIHPYLADGEIASVVEACNGWGG